MQALRTIRGRFLFRGKHERGVACPGRTNTGVSFEGAWIDPTSREDMAPQAGGGRPFLREVCKERKSLALEKDYKEGKESYGGFIRLRQESVPGTRQGAIL